MPLPQYKGTFKYTFLGDYPNKSCVYKILVGDRFFIWKCQSLHNSMYHNGGDMERWIRKNKLKPEHAFYAMVEYIIHSGASEVEVEMVLQSDDPLELLKCERLLLKSEQFNPKCLNIEFMPHIPRWMTEDVIELFNEWNEDL